VLRTLSVARATAPTRPPGIAVIPATPMSVGRAVHRLTSVVRSVVHPANTAAVALATSVAPAATVQRARPAQMGRASEPVVSSLARRL
jgi:hypothetical protein